jgi:hypothetical protein
VKSPGFFKPRDTHGQDEEKLFEKSRDTHGQDEEKLFEK